MRFLTLILCICSSYLLAQDITVFRIDSLPTEGVLLDKGWKFHSGDNPEWAKADFDDNEWQAVNPTQDVNTISGLTEKYIGWLRLKLEIIPVLNEQFLTIMINQCIASEIYINGNLVEKIGNIDPNGDSTIASNGFKRVLISLSHVSKDLPIQLAIKVGYQKSIFYKRIGFGNSPCLRATLIRTSEAPAYSLYFQKQIYYSWFQLGIVFILTFLHLSFFFFFPTQKANLYFSYSMFFLGTAFLCIALATDYIENLTGYFYGSYVETIAFSLAYIFLLRAIYAIFQKPIGIIFWLIAGISLLSIGSLFTSYSFGSLLVEMLSELVVTAEIIRISILAKSEKQSGAKFIMICMIISFCMFSLFYFGFLLDASGIRAYIPQIHNVLPYQIALMGVPIAISLYLAINFSKTNEKLVQKLLENDTLNKRNLIQEQENKQILATQNETLEKQVEERTAELKSTQTQLIQKEKLASLGELTAGIAHEIQNPLNFVNNFSELSVDLAKDLNEEINKSDIDKEYVSELLTDLTSNQEKINHHGKRASSIVKGMLEHSRTSTGIKEPTDINKLIDESLRLSYHAMRAKDKSFNSDFKMDFDENIGKINIIPQDIGRVLLNLFNNAFYAVNERQKLSKGLKPLESSAEYTPSVVVTTFKKENCIEIKVIDNGVGMNEATKAKVFQPFFTTKPTGQGTGLGLSLAYDIVTKGHGGTLEVESTERIGTEFMITLPLKSKEL